MKTCKTYVMRGAELVDVTDAARAPPEPRVHVIGDRGYENLSVQSFEYGEKGRPGQFRTVDISSRSKHQRYMHERGLTHSSDFGQRPDGSIAAGSYWDQCAKRRERLLAGTDPENNRRVKDAVVESLHKLEAGYRPPKPERVEHEENYVVPAGVKTGDVLVS